MTATLILLALLVLVDVVVGVRAFHTNRPAHTPASRRDWSSGLPSSPYALRH
jgi:hypothetical protein